MAVYDGFPSIRLEGDEERALALIPEAKALLYKAQTLKRNAGVNTLAMTRRVDEDSVIYVLSAGDQHILHISVAPDVPERINRVEEAVEGVAFPDFYSGLVYNGYLEERVESTAAGEIRYLVCTGFSPTPNCRQVHDELSLGRQDSARLSVRPGPAFPQLNNNSNTGRPVYSQYTRLRSSMFSGTMKKVAQVVMGLGRIGKEKLRDPLEKVPDSAYIKAVDDDGVQVRFDWRFGRTHGITYGADDRLWLVEISLARGVLARPLPIFPHSDTPGFVERARARGDKAMEYALEELGCLPTGEAFPSSSVQLAELIASGDVLRLMSAADLSPFYDCFAYSSVMGWAFSDRGNEAHNTAYYFGDDGFQRGVWYQVNIVIGALRQGRRPGEPIAIGSASLRKNAEGFIYCPPGPITSYARYVPIKFYEPMLPGLLSHEGVPNGDAVGLPVPEVDTPMFVSFIDGDLKVVKFYRGTKQDQFDDVDDPRYPGECLLAGSWTVTTSSGSRGFPTMMYSNDRDDRRVLQGYVRIEHLDSRDLGYDPPKFSDFISSPEACYVWRERMFRQTQTTDVRGGDQLVSAVVIPQYSREAYYYATGSRYDQGRSGTTSISYAAVKDPNVGYGWRCAPRVNPPPFPPDRPDCNTRVCRGDAPCGFGGEGFPKERRIVCLAYEPAGGGSWVSGGGSGASCHEFADSGEWLSICQNVDSFGQPGIDTTPTIESWNLGNDEKGQLFLVSPGYGGALPIPVTPSQVFNHWMTPSPEPRSGDKQFISAAHSAIGNDMLVYDNGLSSYQPETRTYGYAPDTIGPDEGIPAFIGVNRP